ncbi:MAG TPA: hypothetical protein PJ989_14310, partial [Oligoflexia bacterium]|nr:hypothetical protein [Oligoflexia bacterium]
HFFRLKAQAAIRRLVESPINKNTKMKDWWGGKSSGLMSCEERIVFEIFPKLNQHRIISKIPRRNCDQQF